MDEQKIRDELNEAKEHAKGAVRATLVAMRDALDYAIRKLEEEPEAAPSPQPGDPEEMASSGEAQG